MCKKIKKILINISMYLIPFLIFVLLLGIMYLCYVCYNSDDNKLAPVMALFTTLITAIVTLYGLYQRQSLQQTKTVLNRENEIFKQLTNIREPIQNKRIEIIEKLWENILFIDKSLHDVNFYYATISPEKYNSSYEWINFNTLGERIAKVRALDLDKYRPFIGEKLWLQYYFYWAFYTWVATQTLNGWKKRNITDWRANNHTKFLLDQIILIKLLTKKEKENLVLPEFSSIVNTMQIHLIETINDVLSGREDIDNAYLKAAKLVDKFEENEKYSHNNY